MITLNFVAPGIFEAILLFLIVHTIVSSIFIIVLSKNLGQTGYFQGNMFINITITIIVFVILTWGI